MTFLQPLLLAALPLIAIPVIIHLINLRRHRTVEWGAMKFLLAATRQNRGRTRLRHLLIMMARMLGIAALILAVSRPMAGRWFGLFGSRPETVIVVLDRSPSMSEQDEQTALPKRSIAVERIASALEQASAPNHLVLIESTNNSARILDAPQSLREIPQTGATDGTANLPAMLQGAMEYIVSNKAGRTDIWICSDMRANDWHADSGQWTAIRQGFKDLRQPVRFHLIAFSQVAPGNRSLRIETMRRERSADTDQLVMNIHIRQSPATQMAPANQSALATQPAASADDAPRAEVAPSRPASDPSVPDRSARFPVAVVVDGARSVVDVEMKGETLSLDEHVVPLDRQRESGWGKLELPNDANPRDNVFYFTYGNNLAKRTLVVSDEPGSAWPLTLAAAPPGEDGRSSAQVIRSNEISSVDWHQTALILWQAPLPTGTVKDEIERYVATGGQIMFFPAAEGGSEQFFEVAWGDWQKLDDETTPSIETWRDDSGLLAHTDAGAPLPVNRISVSEFRQIDGPGRVLARLTGGSPLVVSVPVDSGGVYFTATLPQLPFSNLAREGIVFFAMIQRALEQGAARLREREFAEVSSKGTDLATTEGRTEPWHLVEGWPEGRLSTEQRHVAGVYREGAQLLARNRPRSEDRFAILTPEERDGLFEGLNYRVVQESLQSGRSLVTEIWRLFIFLLLLALVAETVLSLPDTRGKRSSQPEVANRFTTLSKK